MARDTSQLARCNTGNLLCLSHLSTHETNDTRETNEKPADFVCRDQVLYESRRPRSREPNWSSLRSKFVGWELVTLDLDFANPLTFDPRTASGVAVFRLSRSPAPCEISAAIETFLAALMEHSIGRRLWIIGNGRVRVWQPPHDDNGS